MKRQRRLLIWNCGASSFLAFGADLQLPFAIFAEFFPADEFVARDDEANP